MIRTLYTLAITLALGAAAAAQHGPIIRTGNFGPQPQGVISPPSLPTIGTSGTPSPTTPPRPLPRMGGRFGGPYYYGGWGYSPYYPIWYDTDSYPYASAPYMNGLPPYAMYPTPASAPPAPTTIVLPTPPVELRARLTLNVPMRSKVWLGGKEMDANVSPLVLESPVLQPGQSYTFDVKIVWPDGNKTEERARTVLVAAGDQTSLTYQN
jgi:uncharacterized protein (TIGR03000 family)